MRRLIQGTLTAAVLMLERFTVGLRTTLPPGKIVSLVRWPSSALKGRPSIARGVNPGNATAPCFLLRPEGAAVPPGATLAPSGLRKKRERLAFPGLTPRAIDERPFRAEDRPWLATRSKRDDLTRPQASGVRNSSVKRSKLDFCTFGTRR